MPSGDVSTLITALTEPGKPGSTGETSIGGEIFRDLSICSAASVALLTAPMALAENAHPGNVGKTAKGDTLVDPAGMTLYMFDLDRPGKSACDATCTTNWPPFQPGPDCLGDRQMDDHQSRRRIKTVVVRIETSLPIVYRQEAGRHPG